MNHKIRVIMKRPGEAATVGELTDYQSMRDYCEGCIETVPLLTPGGDIYLIVCNDEFLLNDSKFNISLSGVWFFGNIFICKEGIVNGELDFVGLDPADIFEIARCIGWSDLDREGLIK